MKIAFSMINCNRRDGSARAVVEVAERLADRGHAVSLFARKAEDIRLDKIVWRRVPGLSEPQFADFVTFQFVADLRIRHSEFDIIHSIGPNSLLANVVTIQNIEPAKSALMRKFASAEKVSIFRRFTRHMYLRTTQRSEFLLYEKYSKRRKMCFLPVSAGVKRELESYYDISDSLIRIVPNAADTKVFCPASSEAKIVVRKSIGLNETHVIALFSGGEWARKGLELAIRAIAQVANERCVLVVAGDDPDRARYFELVKSLGIENRIVFLGFCRNMSEIMGASDFFLFPSHYEAFSLATIEAASCVLPILASKINGTEDFILPNINGNFIQHDPNDIAQKIEQLISNPGNMVQMGRSAREVVESKYTWDRVTDLTEQAYSDLLISR